MIPVKNEYDRGQSRQKCLRGQYRLRNAERGRNDRLTGGPVNGDGASNIARIADTSRPLKFVIIVNEGQQGGLPASCILVVGKQATVLAQHWHSSGTAL